MIFNTRSLTKVAAISSLILGTVASSVIAVPLCQSMTQKSQGKTLVSQSVDEDTNLKFESRGCYRTKSTTVICDVLVTNLGTTRRKIGFGANEAYSKPLTSAIHSSGTVYAIYEVIAGGSSKKSYVNLNFAPGISTKVSFVFEIPAQVTELTALDVAFAKFDSFNNSVPKQIALTNIGAIASKPNSGSTVNTGNNSNCTCPPNSNSPRQKPK